VKKSPTIFSDNEDKKSRPPAVQYFDSEPTDAELTDFVDPFGGGIPRVIDTPEIFAVEPWVPPLWFLVTVCMPPNWLILYNFYECLSNDRLDSSYLLLSTVILFACSIALGIFYYYIRDRMFISRERFFTYDKLTRKLTLNRVHVELSRDQIISLFRLHKTLEGMGPVLGIELSALAQVADGRIARYQVVMSGLYRKTIKISERLSDLLGIPIKTLHSR
jgi:hypothetical protein